MDIENNVEVQQLQSILNKAEKNGFEFRTNASVGNLQYIGFGRFSIDVITNNVTNQLIFHINELLFNHNFARAFFGDQEVCATCLNKLKRNDWEQNKCTKCNSDLSSKNSCMEFWQINLQKMVLENNVLKYLNDNILI